MRRYKLFILLPMLLSACFMDFSDAATRLASEIASNANRVGHNNNAKFTMEHHTPSKAAECVDSYKVQVDKVGAIIIWCYDTIGVNVVSSHSTSSHASSVDTANTYILNKKAGESLFIDLERQGGRVVIVNVR